MSVEKKRRGKLTLADVEIEYAGSLFLFHTNSAAAREWINLHVTAEATYFAGSLVAEPRYALDLTEGMAKDGLRLR